MEQTFSVIVPNVKPNANGDWPQSAKRKAPRFEVPAGTDLVQVEFDLNLGSRPGPGRIYVIGLMGGPAGEGLPLGSLCIGAEDQWLVTAHGGSEGKKDIQEDGDRRVIAKFSQAYFVTLSWQKDSAIIYTIYEDRTKEKVIQQIAVRSTLNLDSGGRILVDQDVKNPKKLKDLHSLPPFGSTITGTIKASDMDIDDEPDDDPTPPPPPSDPVAPQDHTPTPDDPIKPPVLTPAPKQGKVNWNAFPQFVQALDAFVPGVAGELQTLGDIIAVRDAFSDGFSLADPEDVRAVFGLIALIQKL